MANPMKKVLTILTAFCIAALLFAGCNDEFDSLVDANADRHPIPDTEIEAASGDADFSNYVAIGNSLTAGYMDGALYDNGQRFSVAAILAAQLEAAGGATTFVQPDINSENGFNTLANSGGSNVLGRFKLDTSIPGPSPTVNGDEISVYDGPVSELNNFGVPGIKVGQLLTADTGVSGTDSFNPFYERFASSPGSSTVLDDVISADPTFFTLWIGNNDVLGFAASGGTNADELTTQEEFTQQFSEIVTELLDETSARGVVANIPPILALPLFQAVPYNAIELDAATAATLNENFASFNAVLDGIAESPLVAFDEEDADQRRVTYQEGNNPILIIDEDLQDLGPTFDLLVQFGQITEEQRAALEPYRQARQMTVDNNTGRELVLFSAASILGTPAEPGNPNTPIGVAIPLGAEYVLTAQNIVEVETARATFNAIIENSVSAGGPRLALFDTNDPSGPLFDIFGLDNSEPGITVDGVDLEPDFSPNGVFSTDGVHPNARGNALLVNEMIDIIEAEFDAVLPRADVLSYPTVTLCGGDCVSQQGGS